MSGAASPAGGALRVAVFGLGSSGLAHAATLAMHEGCELVALGDPRGTAARRAHGLGFDVPVTTRLARLLDTASPRALVLGVAPNERAAAVRAALEAGVATLVEPPLSTSIEEAEALSRLSRERGVPLAVAHTLPFAPTFAHALYESRAGVLGEVRLARSSLYASRVFGPHDARDAAARHGGGALTAIGLDLLLLLDAMFGTPAQVHVSARRLYGGHEDEAHGMMTLPNGVEVGLEVSWCLPGYPEPAAVLEAECENGVLLVSDDAYEVELRESRAGRPAGHRRVRESELPQPARFDLDGEAREPMVAAFLEWVAGGPAPIHAAESAVRAQHVLEALLASIRRGGTAVRVSA